MTQPLSINESEEPEAVSLRFRFDSETVEQFAERYASDVSRGGIFVHSRQPFSVGTQLRLDLQLLNGTPLIVGEGTVFWTREPDANKPSTVPGMGIRFSKLSGRSQQVIELVLSQRTGRERTGLFPTLGASVTVEESGRILNTTSSNPKSKLPFNVFPGRAIDGGRNNDDRELLATAGREEATPLVGVSAAILSDARAGKDDADVKTPAPTTPLAEVGSGAHAAPGPRRPPLALIKPGVTTTSEAQKLLESGRVSAPLLTRSSSGISALPPITTTQELPPPSGSTPPTPVQGEPALGASQSGVRAPLAGAAPIASVRPPMRNKLIIGAAALLAVTITVFAATRKGPVGPNATGAVARATSATGPESRTSSLEHPAMPAMPTPAGTAPTTGSALEPSPAPSVEPESAGPTPAGHAAAPARGADRRAPKGKVVVAHRAAEAQPAGHAAAPSERPPVAESPAPHVEAPAPPPAPAPAPVAVARAEAPPAVKIAPPTAPPPVASVAHKLRMTSIPSEAEVELDGQPIGRTPLFGVEIDVSRPHALIVHKDGYAPFKQTISSGSEWNVRSSENTATLRISAFMKKLGQ